MSNNFYMQAQKHKKDKNWRMPEYTYNCVFKNATVKPSNAGNQTAYAEWRPTNAPTDQDLTLILEKKRMIKHNFNLTDKTGDFGGFKDFLAFLIDCGLDLGSCRKIEEDPAHQDLIAKFMELELNPPQAKIFSKPQPDSNYYKTKVEEIFINTGAPIPVAPVAAAPVAGPTREAMIAAGWTDEMLAANPDYAHLAIVAAPTLATGAIPVPAPAPVAPTVVAPPAVEVAAPVTPVIPVAAPVVEAPAPVVPVAPVTPVAPTAPAAPAMSAAPNPMM